jgi:hypothetical protein
MLAMAKPFTLARAMGSRYNLRSKQNFSRIRRFDRAMGAKLTLTGPAQKIQEGNTIVKFQIISGPAVKNPPKGLPLYGQVRYEVQCSARQWRKARVHDQDDSDLIVEGYIKPKVDDKGRPFVALVAMSVMSQMTVSKRKQQQLYDAMCQAEDAYIELFDRAEADPAAKARLEAASERLEQAKAGYLRFMERHPELQNQ